MRIDTKFDIGEVCRYHGHNSNKPTIYRATIAGLQLFATETYYYLDVYVPEKNGTVRVSGIADHKLEKWFPPDVRAGIPD